MQHNRQQAVQFGPYRVFPGQRLISGSFNLDQADSALDALLSSQKLQANSLAGRWLIVR